MAQARPLRWWSGPLEEMTRSNAAAAASSPAARRHRRHRRDRIRPARPRPAHGPGVRRRPWRYSAGEIPMIEGARELAALGIVPGGTGRNLDWVSPHLDTGEVSDCDGDPSGRRSDFWRPAGGHGQPATRRLAAVTELRALRPRRRRGRQRHRRLGPHPPPSLTEGSVEKVGLVPDYLGVEGLEGEPHGQAAAHHCRRCGERRRRGCRSGCRRPRPEAATGRNGPWR